MGWKPLRKGYKLEYKVWEAVSSDPPVRLCPPPPPPSPDPFVTILVSVSSFCNDHLYPFN